MGKQVFDEENKNLENIEMDIVPQNTVAKQDENTAKGGVAFFSNLMNKASDIGKKAVDGFSKGVQNLSDETKKAIYDSKIKKYNPLSAKEFRKKDFHIPNIIEVVDDAVRRDIDVCEGSIGWTDKQNNVEILHLYDEWVGDSKIEFLPFAKCDAIYCVDPFDRNRFINVDCIFERTTNEKIAELEHIAYCLGAKKCSIEIVETNEQILSTKANLKVSVNKISANMNGENYGRQQHEQSGKTVSEFEGNCETVKPKLKWFAHDDSIINLVQMRCSGNNSIKSKILKIKGSTSATMSQKNACAIDNLLKIKGGLSMEKQAIREHCSVLVFEVEF